LVALLILILTETIVPTKGGRAANNSAKCPPNLSATSPDETGVTNLATDIILLEVPDRDPLCVLDACFSINSILTILKMVQLRENGMRATKNNSTFGAKYKPTRLNVIKRKKCERRFMQESSFL
jgi:hypothetical protein